MSIVSLVRRETPWHATNQNQNRIGLVNVTSVWIHHVGNRRRISKLAFILLKFAGVMVNPGYAARRETHAAKFSHVNSLLNRFCLGSVGIQDSHSCLAVIQALDGTIRF
ncbi:hypothetical protein AAFX91_16600, partial [Bradyrhizobium sp. 31Argb]|uniref:hypothetical protein n=1 Tax=Bradyrhizobium sp. 31Argb TaxID=3141247 RepID=UPI0037494BEF